MTQPSKFAAIWARAITLALFSTLLVFIPARADVAPPESPPGTNIVPGSDTTQVRMVAEVVTMTVLSQPAGNSVGQAKTDAAFLMRNQGATAENIEVRFPLTFLDGRDNGFGQFPEITDIQISVNGKTVPTRRIESAAAGAANPTPWAAFNVNFPPGQDVPITVIYTADGFGYEPYFALRYVLETGAGWNGTIGTADVIVKLPYAASPKNVLLDETSGFSQTTPGAQLAGNEIHWHFTDFEPTSANNIEVTLLQPSVWRKVLDETANTTKNPNDGEAWGRLGKVYKEIVRQRAFRADPAGIEMYQLSTLAYGQAVNILPDDALWHYGFADLLWTHYEYSSFAGSNQEYSEIARAVSEIQKSLALDPKNTDARDLAGNIASQYPWAISQTEQGFTYLILTATPTHAPLVITETPAPESTSTPLHPPTHTPVKATDAPLPPTPRPTNGIPFCGGAALLPLVAGLLWALSKRH